MASQALLRIRWCCSLYKLQQSDNNKRHMWMERNRIKLAPKKVLALKMEYAFMFTVIFVSSFRLFVKMGTILVSWNVDTWFKNEIWPFTSYSLNTGSDRYKKYHLWLNPNPHGRGWICPHYFQRSITQKGLNPLRPSGESCYDCAENFSIASFNYLKK